MRKKRNLVWEKRNYEEKEAKTRQKSKKEYAQKA